MRKSSIRVSIGVRGKILLLFAASTFLLFAASAFGLREFYISLRAFEQDVALSQNNATGAVAIEADFKKQVQEWKDTLLRGQKPEALEKYWTNFQQREGDVGAEAERLSRNIHDPASAELVTQFIAAHKSMGEAYRRGLQQFKDHGFDSAVGDAAVAGMDRAPTELLTKAKDRLLARASAQASEAADSADWATKVSIVLFAVVMATGIAVFFVALQKGISKPLARLNAVMSKMAGGDTSVEVPGSDRGDEIGTMAKAVLVFRDAAIEKARLEAETSERDRRATAEKVERERRAAEEKVEADRRAAAEREAATTKVMNEFDAAVGSIVKAAMAGDFSQRVALDGKDGVIRNIASAMNTMCADFGKVVDDVVHMLGALAEGDLTARITAAYQGAFASIKDNANATAQRLSQTMAEIKAAASEVASAAVEISSATTDLSQRTEEQAASLEQTSASMEQMSATVRKNAENARQASQSAAATSEVGNRGGAVVAQAVDAMSRIDQSAHKIADIIGVIDEIARQTNLLALNAAVEAARAGEAGRGFAVVASEVRSLAQRSSQAAKDIKDLITNSNTQVKDGVDLVNRAGAALDEIAASIKTVADIVNDIASASAEQAAGIDQINKALTQMDEATQQNSALVEENAATAKTLENQVTAMDSRVGFFRIQQTPDQSRIQRPAA